MSIGSTLEHRRNAPHAPASTPFHESTGLAVRDSEVTISGSRTGWQMRATYLLGDVIALVFACGLSNLGCNLARGTGLMSWNPVQLKLSGILAFGLVVVAMLEKTYSAIPPRPVRQFRGWVLGGATVCGAILAFAWLFNLAGAADLMAIAVATFLGIILASFNRAMCRILFGKSRWWGTRLLVVGDGGLAATAYAELNREPQWGLRPIGYVGDPPNFNAAHYASGYLGTIDQLDELASRWNVDRALVSVHTFESDDLADLLGRARGPITHWIILPTLDRFPSMWLQECEAARLPALSVTNRLAIPWASKLKRAFDLAIVLAISTIVLPVILVIAALVRLTSRGSVFYGQERIGRNGRRFTAWKFRTMIPDADRVLAQYLQQHPDLAAEWAATHKLKRDPRITWIGRWLRPLSLDELPQIWNVISGEMSLVGPRPIVAAEIDKYADRYHQYVQVVPGVTGLWQVSGRNNTTYEERVDLDVYYVQNWSIWLDLYILACTVKVVLLGEGAY